MSAIGRSSFFPGSPRVRHALPAVPLLPAAPQFSTGKYYCRQSTVVSFLQRKLSPAGAPGPRISANILMLSSDDDWQLTYGIASQPFLSDVTSKLVYGMRLPAIRLTGDTGMGPPCFSRQRRNTAIPYPAILKKKTVSDRVQSAI